MQESVLLGSPDDARTRASAETSVSHFSRDLLPCVRRSAIVSASLELAARPCDDAARISKKNDIVSGP